ncbi:hypothetical protein LTR86_000855 [Recurvomyces mirabilis]|nr:hypothetical protein LTR86_000855 [Recurvomyces mirabilis]
MLAGHELRADADMEGPHSERVASARHSSSPGQATLIQTMQDLINTMHSYEQMLNGPHHQGTPEGQNPGGANCPMRHYRQVLSRHGTRPVVYHHNAGNVGDPIVLATAAHLDYITRPNNPNPAIEIDILLMGSPGWGVDIQAWGDRTIGFVKWLLDRDAIDPQGNQFAPRVYLIPVIQQHVLDQNLPSSVNSGHPPFGIWYHNKYIQKHSLLDLVDRHEDLRSAALQQGRNFSDYLRDVNNNHVNALPPAQAQNLVVPLWVNPNGTNANAAYLDRFIMHMHWDYLWRAGMLTPLTVPTDAQMLALNLGRNAPMT